jgi:DNA-binding MarR family transcriptional regulator
MASASVPNDPLSRFSISIFDMNGLLMRSGDQVTRPIGQSSARWQVLGRVGYKPHTVSQMARDMGHARQSVQRIADVLAEEGLVVYRDNPDDRRAKLLELTARGTKVLASIYALDKAWSRSIMKKLDPDRLTALAEALEAIAKIFAAELDDDSGESTRKRE